MKKLLVGAVLAAFVGLGAAPATAGNDTVKSSVKVLFATKEAQDQVGVYAKLKTSLPCKQPKRTFTLFDGGEKVDTMKGLSDAFFITDKVALGDTVQVKAKSATIAAGSERVKCKGSISDDFHITELESGQEGSR
jgi:hypothetical protein